MPCVISFTVETDGRLPTGESLADAIATVDAATAKGPAYHTAPTPPISTMCSTRQPLV
jgi:S-methylmethionine-dependent homocysteine/selenocysteine methylase